MVGDLSREERKVPGVKTSVIDKKTGISICVGLIGGKFIVLFYVFSCNLRVSTDR